MILAIDPGSSLSALVWYDEHDGRVVEKMKIDNDEALRLLRARRDSADVLAIEMAESFGAKVWNQVFVTVLWTGRFLEAWRGRFVLVTRREVKMHVAGSGRADDAQIRNCLIERFGGQAALGTKDAPGPLFGITADCWQALAIAVTHVEQPADATRMHA